MAVDLQPRPHETLDCILGGTIQLLQARVGYRTAIDAPLLAWFAAQQAPDALRALDLGAGSGLVSIVLARALPRIMLQLLEKQTVMADRARRNAKLNGVADRLAVVPGDVAARPQLTGPFDLVLCNPPYLKSNQGNAPANLERRIAHQETSATLAQFCQFAADQMSASSQSCWVFPFHDAERLLADLARAGLGDRAILHVRHRPHDAKPTRVLVRARLGLPELATLPARAIHLQDQPDRVFQPDLADFFARLGAPPH